MKMVILFVILFMVLLIWFYMQRKRKMTILERNGIQGPKPNLIFGNMLQLTSEPAVKVMNNWIEKYGKIFGYYLGAKPYVCVADEELLKLIQVKDFQYFTDREFGHKHPESYTGPELESNLIFTKGKYWKDYRAIATPAFSSGKLKMIMDLMLESTTTLIEIIEKKRQENEQIDMVNLYHGLSMDVIAKSILGVQIDCQNNTEHPFIKSCHSISNGFCSGFLASCSMIFPELDWMFYLLRCLKEYVLNMLGLLDYITVKEVLYNIIKSRRRSDVKKNDLLQMMMDSRVINQENIDPKLNQINKDSDEKLSGFNDAEIVGNLLLFLVAGFDTSSSTLSYITHVLVNKPDLQNKIREEMNTVIKERGLLDYEGLQKLDLLKNVIDETLRLYPPVTLFTTRRANIDYHFKEIIIPKDSGIMIPNTYTQRDPEYWHEPDLFDETRFNDKSAKSSIMYQPFGFGPRVCIGLRYAIMEIKLVIARILVNYRLEPGNLTTIGEPEVVYDSIFTRAKNVFVKFVPI